MNLRALPSKYSLALFIICLLVVFATPQTFAQCSIQTIPNDSIFCGNSKQLKIDVPWNTTTTSVSAILNALYFTKEDIGYAVGGVGNILKTTDGGNTWVAKTSGTTNNLKAVQFIDDSLGFACGGDWGSGCVFLKTENAGDTWIPQNPSMNVTQTLNHIYFINKDTGFVAGGNEFNNNLGFVLKTVNRGLSWSVAFSDSNDLVRHVFFVDQQTGYLSTKNGKIHKTINGGITWSVLYNNAAYSFNKLIFYTPLHGVAIANASGTVYLFQTSNGGLSWTVQSQSQLGITGNDELRDVHFVDSSSGYLFTHQSILKTIDNGLTWSYYNQGAGAGSNAFFMKNAKTVFVTRLIGYPTKISALQFPVSYRWSPSFYISDSNAAQPYVSPNVTTTYYVEATYKNNCVARDTVIIKVNPLWAGLSKLTATINCGYATALPSVTSYQNTIPLNYRWSPTIGLDSPYSSQPQASPLSTTRYYLNVSTFNQCITPDSNDMSIEVVVQPLQINAGTDKILVCGDSIKIVPQQPWLIQSIYPKQFNQIWFANSDTGYALGGMVYKTTDGGKSWSDLHGAGTSLKSMYFINSQVGYVAGDGGLCAKTLNGGHTWQLYYVNNGPNIKSVWFTAEDTGYVAGSGGVIRKTTNGALSWSFQSSNTSSQINALYFFNTLKGIAIGNNGVIRRTTDGGITWSTVSSATNSDLIAIAFVNNHVGYISGKSNVLLKTLDGGVSWTSINGSGIWDPDAICFTDSLTGYVCGKIAATSAIATTNDGGLSWVLQHYGYNNIQGVYAYSPSKVFALAETNLLLLPKRPDKYTWKDMSTQQTLVGEYFRPSQTTTYAVSYELNGCNASDTLTVQVNPLRVSIFPNFVMNSNLVCGSTFHVDSVGCNLPWSMVSYAWDSAVGLTNRFQLKPDWILRNTHKYTFRATTSNGCMAEDTVLIMVNPFQTKFSSNYIDSDKNICGTKLQLDTVQDNSPEQTIQYQWIPGTDLSDSLIQNPLVTLRKNIRYALHATTPSGCISIDTLTIRTYPLQVNAGNDKYAMCGMKTQFDSVEVNLVLDSASTLQLYYQWQPKTGLNNDTVLNPTTDETNLTYHITVTNSEGCTAIDSIKVIPAHLPPAPLCLVTVNEQNKNVLVWEKQPQWAIKSVVIQKETNITGQYEQLVEYPYQYFSTYVDSFSNAWVKSNMYRLQYIDSCGLNSEYGLPHKTMHLTINKGMGTSWNLLWNFYEGFTANTYNIYRGTDSVNLVLIGTTSGSNNSYTDLNAPEGNLYYQVEIVSPYACAPSKTWSTSRSNYMSTLYTGLNERMSDPDFVLYPNPFSNQFSVYAKDVDENTWLTLYNMQGVVLAHQPLIQLHHSFNFEFLPQGMYIVIVRSDKGNVRRFVLKE